jgi:predicted PurR-regulated permease PerM
MEISFCRRPRDGSKPRIRAGLGPEQDSRPSRVLNVDARPRASSLSGGTEAARGRVEGSPRARLVRSVHRRRSIMRGTSRAFVRRVGQELDRASPSALEGARASGEDEGAARERRFSLRGSIVSEHPTTPTTGAGRVTLIVVACVFALGALFAIRSLLGPLLLGGCVAAMVRPWMVWFGRHIRGPKRAAAVVTAAVVLLVALPLVVIAVPLVAELHAFVALVQTGKLAAIESLATKLAGGAPRSMHDVVHAIGPRVADALPGLLGAASEAALGVFVFLMTLYYVLVDGDSAMRLARRVSPLASAHFDALLSEFVEVGRGVLISVGLTAVVEGGAAGIAYFALGLPSAALLTVLTAIAALVPIGTILVWGPIAAILASQGRSGAAAIIVVTGIVVISGIDHLLRPQLTRLAKTRIHPLLVFLGMFGGMASLGAFGLFAGPLVIALGVAAIRLYDRDQRARRRVEASLAMAAKGEPVAIVEASKSTSVDDRRVFGGPP